MNHGVGTTAQSTVVGRRGTALGVVVLLAVLSAATLLTLSTGDGTPSFRRAVAFTTAVCGVASIGGWLISRLPCRNPATSVAASLAAVLLRLTIPLAALAWLQTEGEALREAGADGFLVVFYLLLLAADILLNILLSRKAASSRGITIAN